jgi:HEAT repeat protein
VAKNDLGERVVALLGDERVEVRCAAALVLGVAGKGDARVPKALAARLEDPSAMVTRFVLDALDALGARGLSAQLAPLLASPDAEVRERAMRLLAAQGARAEGALERELAEGPAAARKQAAKLLVERGSAEALDALLEHVADAEIGEHVLQLLRAHVVDGGDEKGRTLLERRATAGVKKRSAKKLADDQVPVVAALLRLLGYLADPVSLPTLIAHAKDKLPQAVRLAAIAGMRRLVAAGHDKAGKAVDTAVAALIDWADDADAQVARAAVDTLRNAQIPEAAVKRFAALAKADNPDARRLATERLAAISGKSAVPQLVERLLGDDHGLRDAAARALAGAPEAAGPVAIALAGAESEDAARRLAHVLRAHGERVPPAAVKQLADAVKQRAAKDDGPVTHVMLEALSHVSAEAWAEILFERAARLRKDGQYLEAFTALRPLAHSNVRLSDEQRFTVGLLGLKAAGRNLLRSARGADPVLMQFAQLVDTGFPVAKQLARQKDLELDDLFTLGFNFVESTDENEKGLGVELLEHVLETQPRGKLGVAAKNKLKLAGELE